MEKAAASCAMDMAANISHAAQMGPGLQYSDPVRERLNQQIADHFYDELDKRLDDIHPVMLALSLQCEKTGKSSSRANTHVRKIFPSVQNLLIC